MDAEKIRNTTDAELLHQQRDLSDQLFRLRFQLKMGQTESLKKLRDLRKDIARIKTVIRERQLGLAHNGSKGSAAPEAAPAPKAERKAAASAAGSRAVKKKAAAPKKTAAKGKK